jgi:PKHD-type hydroxylase
MNIVKDMQDENKQYKPGERNLYGNICQYWSWAGWPEGAINKEVCQKLIKLGKGNWNQAMMIGDVEETKEYYSNWHAVRESDIVFSTEQWVYDLVFPYMNHANENAGWKYNIIAAEDYQVTRYTKGGQYTWHKDGLGSHHETYTDPNQPLLSGNTRKLSMSIVLNSDFEGGDFEIRGFRDDKDRVSRMKGGSIIVFPSFMEHRVTPVTKGTRYSLVVWFVGPPFV